MGEQLVERQFAADQPLVAGISLLHTTVISCRVKKAHAICMDLLVAQVAQTHMATMWGLVVLAARNYPQRIMVDARDQYVATGRVQFYRFCSELCTSTRPLALGDPVLVVISR
jgi:hypothetical protein